MVWPKYNFCSAERRLLHTTLLIQEISITEENPHLSGACERYFVHIHVRCDGCPCCGTHSWDNVDDTSRETHLQPLKMVIRWISKLGSCTR